MWSHNHRYLDLILLHVLEELLDATKPTSEEPYSKIESQEIEESVMVVQADSIGEQ